MSSRIVIIGGGVIGSAVAYFLRAADPSVAVTVIERDPTYARSSSALSAASIRQQFSTPLSIRMSLFGIEFLRELGERLAIDGARPSIDLHEGGYLFLATPAGEATLRENHALQLAEGAQIRYLEREALAAGFPWLNVEDLAAGCYGERGEGWFDGYGLVQALRKKAQSLGARYLASEAVDLVREGRRITHVVSADGERHACDTVVNAAGAWARRIAELAGVEIPVFARRRSIFNVSSPARLERCPLLIDPSGVYFRPEGRTYLCGTSPAPDRDPDDLPLDEVDHALFDEVIWPTLAHRVPGFEALRVENCWSGYYEYNVFDHNAIIGYHPEVENCIFANGFSGHGLQQGPATGRGVSELILHGRYTTLDLSELDWTRVLENRPIVEKNVV
ncbi:NAD(P)/FAD-dependent oxidoreductase [Burkholderia gladioli]|jgi:glycine/D-amino acid oxidase-like deaminating enzyme|uniref:FAD-binding oxidoreductase n=1 Tax=Burkholderia gladioli TaxID=28095 RepID=A0AAW7R9F7_BURGA|nr:FAD-binding oxidoreductase [Burkholderia gladioli]AJW94948.1 pyridine nucleotide-disulfide oxidoreductase family protein [Burkholderia gladioli]ASD84002.1 FAD-binding oxidoreductase [Burkholderia gladioli pv. gladioli]AWY51427.1 FAD-binding oxidoreductase [Burkholderia gladioli pv. gladioli]KAF1058369.1 4-methylaminobutanoate oxidase (formaldehyde-forming) [Burkholderia gladioli]KGC14646.1 pyridine nucleotide-disulfide oxidoreductase family protein [Burkholderia gladioli]